MKNRVGEKHMTNEGYIVEIVEYYKATNCTIKFEDGKLVKNREYADIKKGRIKNLFHASLSGVGYIGIGYCPYPLSMQYKKHYKIWGAVLSRCYSPISVEKFPTYKNVTVCEEWLNFQNFAKWFDINYNPETMKGWQLEKDILVKGNKIYSPETCCFVPAEINNLFTKRNISRGKHPIGVHKSDNKFISQFSSKTKNYIGSFDTPEEAFQAYKIAKELYIKEIADKWRGQIPEKVYNAMYNYKIEITD